MDPDQNWAKIQDPDPNWAKIQDPDPNSMYLDPQHWVELLDLYLSVLDLNPEVFQPTVKQNQYFFLTVTWKTKVPLHYTELVKQNKNNVK